MAEGAKSVIILESDEENENESENRNENGCSQSEEWCFVCHDGGMIRDCDFPKCGKAYHYKCVGQKKPFLTSSMSWNCARHFCSNCGGKPRIMCYCCPKAICHQCIDSAEFFPIKQENGFCKDCMNFVLLSEGIVDSDSSLHKRMSLGDLSTRERYLKEYYEIIKKQYSLTLGDIQSARRQLKNREKRKSCESLDDANKNKRSRVLPRTKLCFNTTSPSEEVVSSKTPTLFAAVVLDNIRLAYLRRRLVGKLLEQPESFENKVKGTFVLVELPSPDGRQRKTRQLVQVTGTRKTSGDHDEVDIKLLASNIPNEISIHMLSNADLSEKDCEDLRQQVQNGLLRMPTVEELEQKARVLHEEIVDDIIATELRVLQVKIDRANEKGWRRELFELRNRRTQLEARSKRLWLLNNVPVVSSEVVDINVMPCGTADDRQGSAGSPISIPIEVSAVTLDPSPRLKDLMDDKMQNEGPAMVILDQECKGSETASVVSLFKRSPGASTPTEEHVRKLVKDPVVNDATPSCPQTTKTETNPVVNNAMPSCPQTADTETNKDPEQLFPEIEQNKPTQGQKVSAKSTAMNTVEPCLEQTRSICFVPAFPLDGKVMTPVVDHHPTMTQQSNNESFLRRELDSLRCDLVRTSTRGALLEDELKALKNKMEHDAFVTPSKISSMEQKLDLMFEHHAKQSGGAQVEPAQEKIISSNKSKMSADDVTRLLEPIKRAGWTEALEEVKAKHLPHLNLIEFPMYDPGSRLKAGLIAKRICESGIQIDHLASLEATEKDQARETQCNIYLT
ncbi:uncharacterized protein [Coffea arabica]|uniref:Uncharacterized protein isoform X4 n=1 Tax=Coffea arabica TaxID=13443 RepID=A0ABM4V012_COFAR